MRTKVYSGKRLRLVYPDFLRVNHEDPSWIADGPDEATKVTITVNPPSHVADSFMQMVRTPLSKLMPPFGMGGNEEEMIQRMEEACDTYEKQEMLRDFQESIEEIRKGPSPFPSITVVRQGEFRRKDGLIGHEQVTKSLTFGKLRWSWMLDAELRGHKLNITINADETHWLDGKLWEEFLDSLEVLGEVPPPEPSKAKDYTKTKKYTGESLRLTYPAFLKVHTEERNWFAFGSKSQVQIWVDPDYDETAAFSGSFFSKHVQPDQTIIREGRFRTAKGLTGQERVSKFVMPVGNVLWHWIVQAELGDHSLHIHIAADDADWQKGAIWRAFLDSIEFVDARSATVPVPPGHEDENEDDENEDADEFHYLVCDGGPHLVLPKELSDEWEGVSGLIDDVLDPETDYGRACAATERNREMALIRVGRGHAIVLANPPMSSWGRSPEEWIDIYYLQHWSDMEGDSLIKRAVAALPTAKMKDTGSVITLKSPDLILLFAGDRPGQTAYGEYDIPIGAGTYRILEGRYDAGYEAVTIYRLQPATPREKPVPTTSSAKWLDQPAPAANEKDGKVGVLAQLPSELNYLLEAALEADGAKARAESLDDHPDLILSVEGCVMIEVMGLTKEAARSRIQSDLVALQKWLEQHPADRHPETAGMRFVAAALNRILEHGDELFH